MLNDEPVEVSRVLEILGPAVIKIVGHTRRSVSYPVPIHEAEDSLAITFCGRDRTNASDLIRATGAGVVLCSDEVALDDLGDDDKMLVIVRDPRLSFLRLVRVLFADSPSQQGIHPTTVAEPEAIIDPSAWIGPYCYLAKCEIGPRTLIYGHVHVYSRRK